MAQLAGAVSNRRQSPGKGVSIRRHSSPPRTVPCHWRSIRTGRVFRILVAQSPPPRRNNMKASRLLLGIAGATLACAASAQDRRPDYGPDVNITQAKKVAAGVIAECTKNSW